MRGGVIFFNNVGYLGMCGHGAIGLIATLAHSAASSRANTKSRRPWASSPPPCTRDQTVSVTNVPSYRKAKGVTVEAPDIGVITGDVAWGGNWFYLVENQGKTMQLSERCHVDGF